MSVPPETFHDGKVTLYSGDCLDALKLIDAASVDSAVTDPPYGLQFMGKAWDHGVPGIPYWKSALRVLKPGGHLVAFSGTRTYHRMVCAIEDAGFEVRDQIGWLFGSGFPKSHDVSKGIDKAAGARREVVGVSENSRPAQMRGARAFDAALGSEPLGGIDLTAPATDAAREWQGWGTALKPAWEPIVLARKPLIGTVAENVQAHGTGALNIDGCRVGAVGRPAREVHALRDGVNYGGNALAGRVDNSLQSSKAVGTTDLGRWPANIITDGSEEVVGAFPESAGAQGVVDGNEASNPTSNVYGAYNRQPSKIPRGDSGSAARFFYSAKADSDDRLGSKHPTVKPLDLMQYLVRLVTPPGGLVLDPFAGTGTTGEAAWREGMRAVLIEREPEYQNDIRRRMKLATGGKEERKREAAKARYGEKPFEPGSLFAAKSDVA